MGTRLYLSLALGLMLPGMVTAQNLIFRAPDAPVAPPPAWSPPAITDRGPFSRVCHLTCVTTNAPTGLVQTNTASYVELGDSLCYVDPTSGLWTDSQDLIEMSADGSTAVAQRAPTKVTWSASADAPVVVDMVGPTGTRLQSRVLGLFYYSTELDQATQIATVRASTGVLYPPNQLVYHDAFDGKGVSADIRYVYTKNAFAQDIVIKTISSLPPPERFGFQAASTKVQVRTAFVQCPAPKVSVMSLKRPGGGETVDDQVLTFGDFWFPTGSAFSWDAAAPLSNGEATQIHLPNLAQAGTLLVAKHWAGAPAVAGASPGGGTLIESVDYLDLLAKLASATTAEATAGASKAVAGPATASGPTTTGANSTSRAVPSRSMLVASGPYRPGGVVVDYTDKWGTVASFNFSAGTWHIATSFTVTSSASFAAGAVVKFDPNAYFAFWGSSLSFPSSGTPVVFSSKDDNTYGDIISGSSTVPGYAAQYALWLYDPGASVTVQNARFCWSQVGIQFDGANGVYYSDTVTGCAFENSSVGMAVNMPNGSVSISQSTVCNVDTPVAVAHGSYGGYPTTDCGVVSLALVNDPGQDYTPGEDPDKNTQTECSFVLVDSSHIVASFFNTHLSQYALGPHYIPFSNVPSPRSTWTASSANGGASFGSQAPLPPCDRPPYHMPAHPTSLEADAGDPTMARDAGNGVIYLLTNPARDANWNGFRLWKSTDNGLNFSQIQSSIPPSGVTQADKDMIAVNNFPNLSTTHDLYVAGTGLIGNNKGIFVTHSNNQGSSWDPPVQLNTTYRSHFAEIAITPSGTVYVFHLTYANGSNQYVIQFHWQLLGQSTWPGQNVRAHPDQSYLYAGGLNASGGLLKYKNDPYTDDYFDDNGAARVAVNPVNGHLAARLRSCVGRQFTLPASYRVREAV